MTAAHDYSDLHDIIERLEPEQVEELRCHGITMAIRNAPMSAARPSPSAKANGAVAAAGVTSRGERAQMLPRRLSRLVHAVERQIRTAAGTASTRPIPRTQKNGAAKTIMPRVRVVRALLSGCSGLTPGLFGDRGGGDLPMALSSDDTALGQHSARTGRLPAGQ
ncbi:hypothetical protein SANTM175S_10936 [Streptomyces antimycoticus]